MLKVLDVVQEAPREIPVWYDVDVLVCGGGPSGIAAAVCAGRMGLSVVLAEMTSHPGGQTNNVTWINDTDNKGGFAKEWFSHLSEVDAYEKPYYNPFVLIPYYDELLKDANVRPLYLATAVMPIVEENAVKGVIFETKAGRGAIRAKVVIDSTGDGDIAARAGAEFHMGRESDGACQAMSLTNLLLGWMMGGIESVYAKCDKLCWDIDVEDTAVVVVKFKNGAVGTIECCTTAYPGLDTVFHVSGSEGNVIIGDKGIYQWEFADGSEKPDTTGNMGGINCAYHTDNYGHIMQIEDMALAVLNDIEPMVSGEDAMRSVSVILAIYESARTGKEIFL